MVETLRGYLTPQVVPILITIATIVLALVLVSVMRRMVTLLLGRIASGWVDKVTTFLQAAVLVGEFAIIGRFLVPEEWVRWLVWGAILLVALIGILLLVGNPIRNGVATLRIRGFRYYRVGNWVTLGDHAHGVVVAIRPFSTLIRTPKQELITVQNRLVVSAPIHVHSSQQEIAALTAIAQNYRPADMANTRLLTVASDEPGNNQIALATGAVAGTDQDAGLSQLAHSTLTLPAALLTKRFVLGRKSIKLLIRN